MKNMAMEEDESTERTADHTMFCDIRVFDPTGYVTEDSC